MSLSVAPVDVHPGFDAHQEAAALANPFKRRLGLFADINASAELFRSILPVSRLKVTDHEKTWWHYGFASRFGSIVLGHGSFRRFRLSSRNSMACLFFWATQENRLFNRIHEAGFAVRTPA